MCTTMSLGLLRHRHKGRVGQEAANAFRTQEDSYRLTVPGDGPVTPLLLGWYVLTRLHAIDPERIYVHFAYQQHTSERVSLSTPEGNPVTHAPEWIDLLTELELIEPK